MTAKFEMNNISLKVWRIFFIISVSRIFLLYAWGIYPMLHYCVGFCCAVYRTCWHWRPHMGSPQSVHRYLESTCQYDSYQLPSGFTVSHIQVNPHFNLLGLFPLPPPRKGMACLHGKSTTDARLLWMRLSSPFSRVYKLFLLGQVSPIFSMDQYFYK